MFPGSNGCREDGLVNLAHNVTHRGCILLRWRSFQAHQEVRGLCDGRFHGLDLVHVYGAPDLISSGIGRGMRCLWLVLVSTTTNVPLRGVSVLRLAA
jgi:hypothetical protein